MISNMTIVEPGGRVHKNTRVFVMSCIWNDFKIKVYLFKTAVLPHVFPLNISIPHLPLYLLRLCLWPRVLIEKRCGLRFYSPHCPRRPFQGPLKCQGEGKIEHRDSHVFLVWLISSSSPPLALAASLAVTDQPWLPSATLEQERGCEFFQSPGENLPLHSSRTWAPSSLLF